MKTIKYDTMPGYHIDTVCKEAVKMASSENCNVEFTFNDQVIIATPKSEPKSLSKFYSDECQRRSDEYRASPEYKARQEEYARKELERKEKVQSILADAPEKMTLKDEDGWKKACGANKDEYGGAVMTYAERWARMMEAAISKGDKIKDVAKEYSHLADEEGITGFMYGCAVHILSQVWVRGEELRRCHNLKVQIGGEGEKANKNGGVLNTACLSLG